MSTCEQYIYLKINKKQEKYLYKLCEIHAWYLNQPSNVTKWYEDFNCSIAWVEIKLKLVEV